MILALWRTASIVIAKGYPRQLITFFPRPRDFNLLHANFPPAPWSNSPPAEGNRVWRRGCTDVLLARPEGAPLAAMAVLIEMLARGYTEFWPKWTIRAHFQGIVRCDGS
jgi:hypothetical protein